MRLKLNVLLKVSTPVNCGLCNVDAQCFQLTADKASPRTTTFMSTSKKWLQAAHNMFHLNKHDGNEALR